MITKKTIGKAIIGITITLVIAFIPLLIAGNEPITGTYYSSPYYIHFSGDKLFKYIFFIGLSIVGMIIIRDSTNIYKSTFYPALSGVIIGIISGLIFPVRVYGWSRGNVYDFDAKVFLIIFGLGVFISLMSLGISFLRK